MSKARHFHDEYHALQKRVRDFLRDPVSEIPFDVLALEIHAFQRRHNPAFALWSARLPAPSRWEEIPAVPQAMFKKHRISCFPTRAIRVTFKTSGTTGENRGSHHFADTLLYDESILAGWERLSLPRLPSLFLSQRIAEVPDSSLAHMFGVLAKHAARSPRFDLYADPEKIRRLAPRGPCAIFGTALAFLGLFERMGNRKVQLPRGSFAFETGGYKGTGRDIPKARLYEMFSERLGLPADAVWNGTE